MYLLDTNHCSRLIDGDPSVTRHLAQIRFAGVFTSVITRGELQYMVEKSARRQENAVKVSAFLQGIRILPLEDKAADIYGIIKDRIFRHYGPKHARLRQRVTLEQLGFRENDLWLASIALQHSLIVASSDGDFIRLKAAMPDLQIENWLKEHP